MNDFQGTRPALSRAESDARAMGYALAMRLFHSDDFEVSEFSLKRTRRLWTEQRDQATDDQTRAGLDGMLSALAQFTEEHLS